MDKARETAVNVLNEVHSSGAYANVALVQAFRRQSLNDMDRRFATELVYGTVKAGATLDWIMKQYIKIPFRKISPLVRDILRIGLYQIFFLDKIPVSAAVNEAVELTKKYGNPGAVKFVNAVLRTAVREPEKATFPTGKGKFSQNLALTKQHPEWLIKRWLKEFGPEETTALCDFDNNPAVLSLRTNTLKTTREELIAALQADGAEAVSSEWSPDGVICRQHTALDKLSALQNGFCQVQDESSMQVAAVVDAQPGEFIIDTCSAPGGKTTHLAALMKNTGRIVALDIYEAKLQRIEENAGRLGISIIETQLLDAREVGTEYENMADRVLVDAPCSGLGVLRRKPDARWRKEAAEIDKLPELQLSILTSAGHAVKSGGVLVYSTCTINEAENQGVVEAFLTSNPQFKLETTGEYLPVKKRSDKMVQFYPQRDNIDGFFIARMRKE